MDLTFFQEHPGGYTVYKVVHTWFPAHSPDLATTITAWKRWAQIKVSRIQAEVIRVRALYRNFFDI